MKKKLIIAIIFLFVLGVSLYFPFYPRTYNAPQLEKRENTQYWTLATGSKIAYTFIAAQGLKKSYPIIYLHGGPGGFISETTLKMLSPLSENGYDIYLYDQIGSGHSDRLENIEGYTANRHKQDLEAILKTIGAKKVILIGQSWGALLAILFAADNADKVEKLILTGAGPIYPVRQELRDIKPPNSLNLKQPLYSNKEANEKISNLRTQTVAFWAKAGGHKLASDKEMDDFQTLLGAELNKSTVCDTSKAAKAKGGNGYYVQNATMYSLDDIENPRPKLKDSKIPLFIMRGQCDNQKWGFITEYLTLFPNHRLVHIPNAGHSIAVEQPVLYLSTLRIFLNE
jgi:proline iminopeptidase